VAKPPTETVDESQPEADGEQTYPSAVCSVMAFVSTKASVVAANRDERLDRRARPMTVLRHAHPRILGRARREAGGTWLA